MNSMRAWIRITLSPPILRRALATCVVVGVILTLANHGAEVFGGRLRPDHLWPIAFTFIVPFVVATISSAAVVREPDAGRHETNRSTLGLEAVATFPESNPSPVLRLATSDVLLYANPASAPLLEALGASVGAPLPPDLATRLRSPAGPAATRVVQIEAAGHTYLLNPVAISDRGFINVYGTEVTELEKAKAAAA
jgi:hypothetical protein